MRKIISLVMVLAMILSVLSAMTFTSSANATWKGAGNSTWNGADDGSGIDYVNALYFETAPTIDGYVTEAEWGERTIELYSEDLGNKDFATSYYNSFFYWKGVSEAASLYPMAALVWLRWDENYFYVAALVRDYNAHSLKHGKGETWNGDALQFRVDPMGANAKTGGGAYDPELATPWSDATKIPDFLVGYVQIAGGFVECFESTNDKGLTAYSKPVFGEVKVAVAPSEQNASNPLGYHADAAAGYTTYEVAIPWKYIYENDLVPNYKSLTDAQKAPYVIDYSEFSKPSGRPGTPAYKPGNEKGGIGRTLGLSLAILSADKGDDGYKSFISWGSGITSVQTDEAPQTCAGSNEVKLVADKVVPGDYAKYDPSKLNASVANKKYDNVFYDYLAGDTGRANAISDANALTKLTYDNIIEDKNDERNYELAEDQEYWGSFDLYNGSVVNVGGDHGNVLSFDKVLVTHDSEDGNEHYEAGVDAIDQFYIDTQVIAESAPGAGDGVAMTYPLSYTIEFDVMYTGLETVQEGRASELGNLFGGSSAEYYCGYSFVDKKFVVRSFADPTDVIAQSKTYDLQQGTWYNWKFQYDNDTCTVRLLINDEVIFNINNRYFYYSNEKNLAEGCLMCWWFINTQMKMDNVKIYNFYDYVHKESTNVDNTTGTGNGGGTNNGPVIEQGGSNIEVDKDQIVQAEDGTFSFAIKTQPHYKTATKLSYTFTLDPEKFEIVEIKGLDASDYKLEKAEDGKYTLTILNIAKVKAAATGSDLFTLVIKGKNGATIDDLANVKKGGLKVDDSFEYESAPTGDSMIFVAAIAVVMLAGCAVVVSKKKRSF